MFELNNFYRLKNDDINKAAAAMLELGTRYDEEGRLQLIGNDEKVIKPSDYKKVMDLTTKIQREFGKLRRKGYNETLALSLDKGIGSSRLSL